MIVRISVSINTEPADNSQGSWGNVNFAEEAQLSGSDFPVISDVFRRIHDLLAALKAENAIRATSKPERR